MQIQFGERYVFPGLTQKQVTNLATQYKKDNPGEPVLEVTNELRQPALLLGTEAKLNIAAQQVGLERLGYTK